MYYCGLSIARVLIGHLVWHWNYSFIRWPPHCSCYHSLVHPLSSQLIRWLINSELWIIWFAKWEMERTTIGPSKKVKILCSSPFYFFSFFPRMKEIICWQLALNLTNLNCLRSLTYTKSHLGDRAISQNVVQLVWYKYGREKSLKISTNDEGDDQWFSLRNYLSIFNYLSKLLFI